MLAVMGEHFKGRLTRYVSAKAEAAAMPQNAPVVPENLLSEIAAAIDEKEAPFKSHLARARLEWLESDSDRLGNTHFEISHAELEVRKRQRMPPGPVTVGLHPILAEDEALYRHTLAHELLHVAGLTDHDDRHASILNQIAPAPSLAESALLRNLRDQALAQQEVQDWTCNHCGFIWSRKTVRAPARCPKCARPFK